MAEITHVLDTSAIVAHYFDEPGAGLVHDLFASRDCRLGISVVSVTELHAALARETAGKEDAEEAVRLYVDELAQCIPVDRALAEMAWHLRLVTTGRLPLVALIVAATARAAGAILVHKDAHFARIPGGLAEQVLLS